MRPVRARLPQLPRLCALRVHGGGHGAGRVPPRRRLVGGELHPPLSVRQQRPVPVPRQRRRPEVRPVCRRRLLPRPDQPQRLHPVLLLQQDGMKKKSGKIDKKCKNY